MLFSVLRKVPLKGKLDIIDSNGKMHNFGASPDLASDNLYCKNKLYVQKGSVLKIEN